MPLVPAGAPEPGDVLCRLRLLLHLPGAAREAVRGVPRVGPKHDDGRGPESAGRVKDERVEGVVRRFSRRRCTKSGLRALDFLDAKCEQWGPLLNGLQIWTSYSFATVWIQ